METQDPHSVTCHRQWARDNVKQWFGLALLLCNSHIYRLTSACTLHWPRHGWLKASSSAWIKCSV